MKFLHTGDWHLGKRLRAQERLDEYAGALNEVLDIARRERVDCLLVAGDVFDSMTPPPEAERLLYDFLRELIGAGIPAAVIGGNHDHPKRLQGLSRVLELVNVHVRGDPLRADKGGTVQIASRDGSETATIAMLPWVDERRVISYEALVEERSSQQFADRVAKIARTLVGGLPADTVNVLLSHMMVDGAQVGGGERELHLGAVYAVKPQSLPHEPSYIALGHVHRPQEIAAPAPARYAGSLLQLDFGETKDQKSVVLVEAHPGRPARAEEVRLTSGRRLRDLEGTLTELQAQADQVGNDYLRVRVLLDGPTPGLTRQVREFLPNALEVVPIYPQREERSDGAQRLRSLSPEQLLADYHQATYGSALPEPVLELFRQLQQEVDGATP